MMQLNSCSEFFKLVISGICLFQAVDNVGGAYTYSLENNLRTLLWTTNSYQKFSRPEATVTVNLTFFPITLNTLNIVDQSLNVAGFFSVTWKDSRLAWSSNPTYSSDIGSIFSTSDYVWYPVLIVENSVSDISIMMDTMNPIRIVNDGVLNYNPIDVFETHCESESTYYPFDMQSCEVVVATWGYSSKELTLAWDDRDAMDMTFFNQNGEWTYISYTSETGFSNRGTTSFSTAKLHIKFQRRPAFQITNTILPCMMLAFLICATFKLPPESGERMGFSLTVLLAYAVYLTLVSASLPTTSITTSVMSMYLLITLTAGVLSVLASIFVLRCHHQSEDTPIPTWLKRICNGCCGKIAGYEQASCCGRKINNVEQDEHEKNIGNKKMVDAFNGNLSRLGLATDVAGNTSRLSNHEKTELTWQKVTTIVDEIAFRVFLSFTILEQIAFLIAFSVGYYSQ